MSHLSPKEDECFILVKAQPHRSSNYFETVCCAGIGRDGRWRRQYPVPYRILASHQKFTRWQWIRYRYVDARYDKRWESQKVDSDSIELGEKVPSRERAHFLNPLTRADLREADDHNESLTIIRPKTFEFTWVRKSDEQIHSERTKHAEFANQFSMFDKSPKPLEPCPFEFTVTWTDIECRRHHHICDDWETSQALRNFSLRYGETEGLIRLRDKYDDYMRRGLVLAFSTHSRRNATYGSQNQWLLVGLIRLDFSDQSDLFL